jgi:glyoxylase-like metal-dependent hydrolase (beta-lactamase superfamily II)
MNTETYRVYAIKYAQAHRMTSATFIGGDMKHDVPIPLDFFVWVVVGKSRAWIVDTGFDQAAATARGRTITRPVADGLAAIGIHAADVQDVIITHMHYDHAGNRDLFPRARYHVQDREMAYCTGRCMCHATLNRGYDPQDVSAMVHRIFDGRVEFHNGDAELAPGLSLHHMGGHTDGVQVVRVRTEAGMLVLASDTSILYEHMASKRPFQGVYNVGDMLEGFQRVTALADSPQLVIPGHDPQVLQRFHPASREQDGWIARLDTGLR